MSQPAAERSAEQVARERAMGEVSDVLLTVEHALDRARRALKVVRKDGADTNAELALVDAVKELERVRKRLTQDTYFAGDALRML
jgi:predicted O-methyltransferase YrrM